MAVEIGEVLKGKVTGITNFGAFVELPDKTTGMVHISEVSNTFIKDIHEKLAVGDEVTVKVLEVNEKGKIALSIKKALPREEGEQKQPPRDRGPKPRRSQPQVWTGVQQKQSSDNMSFEDMMARFKSTSDDKMSDLKKNFVSKRGAGTPKRGGRG
jgi:S1 RNA binding domain protein